MGTQSFSQLVSIGSPSVRSLSLPDGDESNGHATSISELPDDVLLDVFDFYRQDQDDTLHELYLLWIWKVWKWHVLAHVCQRWRHIVCASPHRLHLQILCTSGTLVRKDLGIWPAFPIVLDLYSSGYLTPYDKDNAINALGHPDRVRSVRLDATGLQLGKMVAVMQKPFPVLTHLYIVSKDINEPVFPAEFLGGSAPYLQEITLSGVPYPALPMLLLSASDLVIVKLRDIPPTGYISPETMVACLAALSRLESFTIEFQSPSPRPDQIHPPPETQTILPALTFLQTWVANEYLEDFVTRIDSPQLKWIFVKSLDQPVDFQVPQLSKFIGRSAGPELTPFWRADVNIYTFQVAVTLYRHANYPGWDRHPVQATIRCNAIGWHVSHIAQVLSQFSATLSNVVHLKLEVDLARRRQLEGTDHDEWVRLLHRFSAVQSLFVSWTLAWHVALTLEGIAAGMVAEVLPSLHLICLEGQPASSVEKFVAARRLSYRPVTVVDTRNEFYERLESYVNK